jgi:hypothetical protein
MMIRYSLQICRMFSIVYRTKRNFDNMYKGSNLFLQDIKINMDKYMIKKKRDSETDLVEII